MTFQILNEIASFIGPLGFVEVNWWWDDVWYVDDIVVAAVVGVDSEIQEHHLGVNHDDAQGGVAPGGEPDKGVCCLRGEGAEEGDG